MKLNFSLLKARKTANMICDIGKLTDLEDRARLFIYLGKPLKLSFGASELNLLMINSCVKTLAVFHLSLRKIKLKPSS